MTTLIYWNIGLSAKEIFIDIDMIGRVMLSLPTKLVADRDGIPAILLHKSASTLSTPFFYYLWQKSHEEGYVPVQLVSYLILPQLKPGLNKLDPSSSFRLIALTS